MTERYFLELAYHGKAYHGWQIQENALSIQAIVEDWLSKITGERIRVTASGRTDAGVHAERQVIHADLPDSSDSRNLMYRLNAVLPPDIAVKSVVRTVPEAHARFSACSRSYCYKIHRKKNPFLPGLSHFVPGPLDSDRINEACRYLLGEKDFESFSKIKTSVSNFRCNITEAYWLDEGDRCFFNITANRFLRGMVRAIVGGLLEIGKGNLTGEDFNRIIEFRDRKKAGKAAPACGLYLTDVKYPAGIFIDNYLD